MRLRPADILRPGCAMDAVAWLVEANPGGADRVVRAGLQNELSVQFARFGGFRKDFGVKGVIRVRSRYGDVQLADGPFLDTLGDAAREVNEQIGRLVERFQ